MRLSGIKQDEIEKQILGDLYDKAKQILDNKKGDLVVRNHAEWLTKYSHLIDQLPEDLVRRSESVKMEVPAISNDEFDLPIDAYEVCQSVTWTEYVTGEVPVMAKGSSYSTREIAIELQPGMKAEVIALRIEDKKLRLEKDQMSTYLSDTMIKHNTTSKLRLAFPSTLQKYIPAEPPRAPRKPKQSSIDFEDGIEAPVDTIKQRLTDNLLNS